MVYLRQACAAGRRSLVGAPQRETAEEAPAALERVKQGCAVLPAGRRYRMQAQGVECRSIEEIRLSQELPGGR